MSTQSGLPYHPLTDPGMISTQHDPLCHSVYLMNLPPCPPGCCPQEPNTTAIIKVTPPTPPFQVLSNFEAKLWEAIVELKATIQHQSSVQNPPPVESIPNPCIALLTDQMATFVR
ncbi:hypothetical protein DSO57_1029755 [Entomophthora muscae]|uniref:Uncharacterized protein n=1 Tax=Entomophthora muscae TaxID=34485 RepID=A0ACC2UB85_9FUNG|nr:hypothetical protein DSO57_1029755 [Entomophthora muscae]